MVRPALWGARRRPERSLAPSDRGQDLTVGLYALLTDWGQQTNAECLDCPSLAPANFRTRQGHLRRYNPLQERCVAPVRFNMFEWLARRYLDVLGSIYIYNEHRGYTAIDRVLEAVRVRYPTDRALAAAIEQHRADERKHYVMFRRWFELRGEMPLSLDRAFGHIDRFVEIMFHKPIDSLDTQAVIDSDELFERLCRVISLTERRGYRTVEALLRNPIVLKDPVLTKIFRIIHKDEPSHWAPYEGWLAEHAQARLAFREKLADRVVHSELLLFKLPFVFLNPWLRRQTNWADATEVLNRAPAG